MKKIYTVAAMMKRTLPAAGALVYELAPFYMAEEDVTVIGFEINLFWPGGTPDFIGNDGVARYQVELSPTLPVLARGALCLATGEVVWNTAPASVQVVNDHVVVFFPEGYGITVMEEGTIGCVLSGSNSSIADVTGEAIVRLYYIKGIK